MSRRVIKRGIELFTDLDVPKEQHQRSPQKKKRSETTETNPSNEAMILQRIVGNLTEWRRCRLNLFSENNQRILEGIAQVEGWRVNALKMSSRCTVPAYIEATVALVDAARLDRAFRRQLQKAPLSNDTELHLTHSTICLGYVGSISRTVHLLAEERSVSDLPQSYRLRARKISMPEELVEIRNYSAHGRPPPLPQMRFAVALGLRFLAEHYWDVQEQESPLLLTAESMNAQKVNLLRKNVVEQLLQPDQRSEKSEVPLLAEIRTQWKVKMRK